MPVFQLDEEPLFPPPELSESNGLLAVGGDLSATRLLTAYSLGIFPWFNEGEPIYWWSPDPRFVLFPEKLHIGRSLKKNIRRKRYEITFNRAFDRVIIHCAKARESTWITNQMMTAYFKLHQMGYAHSVEAWVPGEVGKSLVGGLYGVALGGLFCGESMFALQPDASKVAFAHWVYHLKELGFSLIDCQMETQHLARFGAEDIPRETFLELLQQCLEQSLTPGRWETPMAPLVL